MEFIQRWDKDCACGCGYGMYALVMGEHGERACKLALIRADELKQWRKAGHRIYGVSCTEFPLSLQWLNEPLKEGEDPVDVEMTMDARVDDLSLGEEGSGLADILANAEAGAAFTSEWLTRELLSPRYDLQSVVHSVLASASSRQDLLGMGAAQVDWSAAGLDSVLPPWLRICRVCSFKVSETSECRRRKEEKRQQEQVHQCKLEQAAREGELLEQKKRLEVIEAQGEAAKAQAQLALNQARWQNEQAQAEWQAAMEDREREREQQRIRDEVERQKMELEKVKTEAERRRIELELQSLEQLNTQEFLNRVAALAADRLAKKQGPAVNPDWAEVTWRADNGGAVGQFELSGHLDWQDPARALELLMQSAEKGYAPAQEKLGLHFHRQKNYAEAEKWFSRAAGQGLASAQDRLGVHYYQRKDYAKAVAWFRKAAGQGCRHGERDLALCYYGGLGVVRDYAEAVKLLRPSADVGDYKAERYLGKCYKYGRGVPENPEKARYWLERASNRGDGKAQEELADVVTRRTCVLSSGKRSGADQPQTRSADNGNGQENLAPM